jgi:multiple sugar transport system ATP-binding protein
MASVTFSTVSKEFADGTRAVSDLDLAVADGEFMVLLGPSGCGKTTTLRLTAGLDEVTDGEIRIGDRVVNALDPRDRDVAMVFQNYALYPHMRVYDNLAFPLRARGLSKQEIRRRVERIARLLGLEALLDRKPRALSGGQRQRVAMGRAIVREPQVFLMDEPLSNLDATLRSELRAEIVALQRELGVTTMYVTHDQLEAMTMGARIAVLRDGVLQQQGPPQHLYDEPENLFVATFLGSPKMNVLRGCLDDAAERCILPGGGELAIGRNHPGLRRYAGKAIVVGVRSEHLGVPGRSGGHATLWRGRVERVELLGAEQLVHLEIPGGPARVVGRFDVHATIRPQELIEVGVADERLHFFDPVTGDSIR